MELKDIISLSLTSVTVFVGMVTIVKLLFEYRNQGITKRAEIFLQMRTRLREDESFKNICDLLETDDVRLRDLSLVEKDRFIGFFEEFSLIKNSGFVNNQVSLYMFGYFSIRCLESKNFWHGLNKTQQLWILFFDFAEQMKEADKNFKYEREKFRL